MFRHQGAKANLTAEVQYSQLYAFTLTLKPKFFVSTAEKQYDETINIVKHELNRLGNYTVIAEFTKNYNVHYHGIISFPLMGKKNLMKLFSDHFRNHKQIGFVNIKPLTDEKGWIEYICKGLKETRDTLKCEPVIYDGLDKIPNDVFNLYSHH